MYVFQSEHPTFSLGSFFFPFNISMKMYDQRESFIDL